MGSLLAENLTEKEGRVDERYLLMVLVNEWVH